MLDERKILAIQLIVDGKLGASEIAEKCKVSRQTLWEWKTKDKEFIAEVDRLLQEIKDAGKKTIYANMNKTITNIIDLANNAQSEKTKLDANCFLYESIFGKATSKVDINSNDDEKDDPDKDSLDAAISEVVENKQDREDEE